MEEDTREKIEADVNAWFPSWDFTDDFRNAIFRLLDRQAVITAREISNDIAIAETGDAKLMNECITVFGMSLDEINSLRKIKSEQSMMASIAEKYRADAIAAQLERDAYRDLCGRMRQMANEMLVMEVD